MSVFQAWPAIGFHLSPAGDAGLVRIGPPRGSPCLQPPYSRPEGSFSNLGLGPHILLKPFPKLPLPSASRPHFLARCLVPRPLALPPSPALPLTTACSLPCCSQNHPVWTPSPSRPSSLPCSLHSVDPAWKEPPHSSSGYPLPPYRTQLSTASLWSLPDSPCPQLCVPAPRALLPSPSSMLSTLRLFVTSWTHRGL